MGLETWVVYRNPKDYPDKFVCRKWDGLKPTGELIISDALEKIHQSLPLGLIMIAPSTEDDPIIIETWF